MYIFKLKPEFKNKIYWNNPKYKLVNFENILKCFEKFESNFYNLNWTSQRHFWLNLQNPDNVITTNKYFLIAPVANLDEILKNRKIDWKIVYVNSFTYLNQQKTLLKVNFEVDNFFDLLKHNQEKLEISGLLSRTTLPKYTYAKIIENGKEKWTISPNVLLSEDMNVSPYLLTKINELFRYNKPEFKNLYFYADTNNISLKTKNESDIKNNIIRKPLFISNEYKQGWNEENIPFIDDLWVSINTNINVDRLNSIEKKTLEAIKIKFRNERFFIFLPVTYKKGSRSFYLDLTNPYSILYPNTFIYRDMEDGKRVYNPNRQPLRDEYSGITTLDENTGTLKGAYAEVYNSGLSITDILGKTSRYFVITFENVYLGYEDNIIDFATYKSVPNLLKSNIDFAYDNNGISPYLELAPESVSPSILDDIYFDHPEKKVKGGFLNASPNEINRLFKRLFIYYLDNSRLNVQNLFNEWTPEWKTKLNDGVEEFYAYLKGNIQKNTVNFKEYIKFSKNNVSRDWKEYISTLQTQYTNAFKPHLKPKYNPKLLFNKQYTNYLIISPNTRQEVDLDLFFANEQTIEIDSPTLFYYHYSENEFYDAGYSLLSYPFYNKNFVTKYLKNDTILSNAHVEHLKTNVNSINFQKQQESITLARAYQDRTLGFFNAGVNLLTMGFQYRVNNMLDNPTYHAIGTNILAQNAFHAATSIIGNTISANRNIEDSKRAIAKFYATQNDLYLQNKIDQNIVGIESLLEIQEEAASLYKQTLTEKELEKANKFFNKWGWRVNEYITEIPFNNTQQIANTNLKFDYVELEDIDFLPYLTSDENIYLQDVFKIGVWLIYDPSFSAKTFFTPQPPIIKTQNQG